MIKYSNDIEQHQICKETDPDIARTIADVASAMIARSPHRRDHILKVAHDVNVLDKRLRYFFVPKNWYEAWLSSTGDYRLCDGQIVCDGFRQDINLNFFYNDDKIRDKIILAHEFGHAVNSDISFDPKENIETLKVNCGVIKSRISFDKTEENFNEKLRIMRIADGPRINYIRDIQEMHGIATAEALNSLHTNDIMNSSRTYSSYEPFTRLLSKLREKFNLAPELLESDETNNLELFNDTLNKKVKLARSNELPAEIFSNYCEKLLAARLECNSLRGVAKYYFKSWMFSRQATKQFEL